MSRRKARVVAFKVLFQFDQVKAEPQQALSYLYQEDELTAPREQSFAAELVYGAIRHLADIDEAIRRFSREWDLSRMSAVDRNIMRLAAYEILFMQPSEPVVAIDEAVEIAKRYGDHNSPGFINAILDRILGEKYGSVPGT
ncbi:MAG: transcription antitermination factor NusB [Syntrophomonadaceae bacterium]|nr:transcription antitermination factor NusB [Syntrophomonadaceae bacterium]